MLICHMATVVKENPKFIKIKMSGDFLFPFHRTNTT